MKQELHLSDATLLSDVDGELGAREEKLVRAHLGLCWACRTRRAEMERAVAEFVRLHQGGFAGKLPPAEGPRALLRARMAQAAEGSPARRGWMIRNMRSLPWAAAALSLALAAITIWRAAPGIQQPQGKYAIVDAPNARLTPGAAVLSSQIAVCAGPDAKNKTVPVSLRKQVFEEYGIRGADPRAYEVDYLVTPALGGADDIHNLWPHSYHAAWNARVKDQLEDRLRALVCDGSLNLASAQREIATDWIAAYKKYFHTDKPLE
jgi:anti-sigma factor RsiW